MRRAWLVLIATIGCRTTAPGTPIDDTGPKAMAVNDDDGDKIEWALLHDATGGTNDVLGPLASYYDQHQAWDEYSAVRARMLDNVPPGPGPAPGGPFPRIGLPRDHAGPNTVLSRWLNAHELPELFQQTQVEQRALEATLRALPPSGETRVRLATVLCSELQFAEAAKVYEQALAEFDDPTARERLADARRILRGHR